MRGAVEWAGSVRRRLASAARTVTRLRRPCSTDGENLAGSLFVRASLSAAPALGCAQCFVE